MSKIWQKLLSARAEIEALRKRVGELDDRLLRQYAILLEYKSRAEQAEAQLANAERAHKDWTEKLEDAWSLNGTTLARAERAEAELEKCKIANASWQESYCKRHNDSIEQRERAERAEAQLLIEKDRKTSP